MTPAAQFQIYFRMLYIKKKKKIEWQQKPRNKG